MDRTVNSIVCSNPLTLSWRWLDHSKLNEYLLVFKDYFYIPFILLREYQKSNSTVKRKLLLLSLFIVFIRRSTFSLSNGEFNHLHYTRLMHVKRYILYIVPKCTMGVWLIQGLLKKEFYSRL